MESTIEKMENGSIWSSIWDWLKGLFKKREEEAIDTAMFHCSDCGNDFEAKRYITRWDFPEDAPLTEMIYYFPMKCPKCGNWATTQKTIHTYNEPYPEANNIHLNSLNH